MVDENDVCLRKIEKKYNEELGLRRAEATKTFIEKRLLKIEIYINTNFNSKIILILL
jgi:hypothetical protein